MKLFRSISLCIVLFLTLASSVSAQQIAHDVKQGETLYRISKQYGVTVGMILEKNPGLNAENLQPGTKIAIPSFGAFPDTPLKEHKVRRGETLYGIAKEYGISLAELELSNPHLKEEGFKLKRGMLLNIPAPGSLKAIQAPVAAADSAQLAPKKETPEVRKKKSVKIAVLLPLKSAKGEGERSLEFYRGLLMAAEQFKTEDADLKIYAFDEGTASDSIGTTLTKIEKQKVDLLISPVYFPHFASVGNFSKRTNTKVLVPFSSKVSEISNTPQMYLLNTPLASEVNEVCKLLKAHTPNARIVFIDYIHGNKKDLTTKLQSVLVQNGFDAVRIEVPEKTADIREHLSANKKNIIMPNTVNEEVLANLLKTVEEIQQSNPKTDVSLLGYPDWADYLRNHPIERLSKSIYFYTNSFYNALSPDVLTFESIYKKWFKQDLLPTTPRMAALGYDCGIYFIDGFLKHGAGFTSQATERQLLQSAFKFDTFGKGGGRINKNVWLMQYKKDGTFVKLSY